MPGCGCGCFSWCGLAGEAAEKVPLPPAAVAAAAAFKGETEDVAAAVAAERKWTAAKKVGREWETAAAAKAAEEAAAAAAKAADEAAAAALKQRQEAARAAAPARLAKGYTEDKLNEFQVREKLERVWKDKGKPWRPLAGTLQKLRGDFRVQPTPEFSGDLRDLLRTARQADADYHWSLPKEKQDELQYQSFHDGVDPDGEKYYKALSASLADGCTAIIRSDYLEGLAAQGQPLGHRAQLPDEAFYEGPIFDEVVLVALSYMWLYPDHPDPHGEQLNDVIVFLRWLQKTKGSRYEDRLSVVMWDWASLYQDKPAGSRSAEHTAMFKSGLHDVNLWYASPLTLTLMNQKAYGGPREAPGKGYEDSGWPSFERAVSEFLKDHEQIICLHTWLQSPMLSNFTEMCAKCGKVVGSRLPVSPDAFNKCLPKKHFTNGADCSLVSDKYRKTFEQVVLKTQKLNFENMEWVSTEAWAAFFDEVFPGCRRLIFVNFRGNPNLKVHILKILEAAPTTINNINIANTGCFGDASKLGSDKLPKLQKMEVDGTKVTIPDFLLNSVKLPDGKCGYFPPVQKRPIIQRLPDGSTREIWLG